MNENLPETKKSWAARLLKPSVAIPLLILFLPLCAPFAYRGYKLSLVPDPGEPFDVAAFIKSSQVDDADNALFDFQKAISLRGPKPNVEDWDQIFEELISQKVFSQETQDLIKFIEGNKPAMQAWETGTMKPRFCEIPFDEYHFLSLFPVSQESREFVRLFVASAILNVHDGKYEEASNHFLSCVRTAQLIRQNGGDIQVLVSNADYAITINNLVKVIQDQNYPADDLKKLLQDLANINDTFSPMSETLKGEYISSMNLFEASLKNQADFNAPLTQSAASWILYFSAESELFTRLIRQWHGNMLSEVDLSRNQRSLYSGEDALMLLFASGKKTLHNPRQLSPAELEKASKYSFLFIMETPVFPYLIDSTDRRQIRCNLLVTVLKLEIYRRKHGSYPAKLEDVFPDGKVPVDIFDPAGAPLHYAKKSDQACKVWSVSFNGVDDGGMSLGFGKDDTDFGYQLGKQEKPQEENDE